MSQVARRCLNEKALVAALGAELPRVSLTRVELADLPFGEQAQQQQHADAARAPFSIQMRVLVRASQSSTRFAEAIVISGKEFAECARVAAHALPAKRRSHGDARGGLR